MILNRIQLRIVAALIVNYIEDDADASATAETAGVEIAAVQDFMRDVDAAAGVLGTSLDPYADAESIRDDGPVALTHETGGDVHVIARFPTISAAEAFLNTSADIDADDLGAGRYGIDAPHGVGNDDEAVTLARELGFDIFNSMGASRYARKGYMRGPESWSKAFDSKEAAAHAVLATVEP